MFARNYKPGVEIQPYGRRCEEVVLILEGHIEMFLRSDALDDPYPFMRLPPNCIFNDYQLLFDLKSNIAFKSWIPEYKNEK